MAFSLKNFSKKHYIWTGIIVLVIIVLAVKLSGNGNGNGETYIVERRDIVDEVSVSGRVEAGTVADLGFEVSGRVSALGASVGDIVAEGAVLLSLDLGTLSAELAQARANVLVKQAEAANAQTNLDDVITQQNTLVNNAYHTLLSSGLEAEPSSESVTVTPPIISGRYVGMEGQYKIRIKRELSQQDSDLYVFGLESPEVIEINETGSTPIGTRGLFISFPEDIESYDDTVWYVDVPNIDGVLYTSNLNAYEQALNNKEVAIEAAQAAVVAQQSGGSIAEAELIKAQADVLRIEAEIAKRRLLAPFTGAVGSLDIEIGESVSANAEVVQLISEGDLGVEIDIPEIDSVKVANGDKATVTLDAFGDSVVFEATVLSINVTETLLDNVAVYEARVGFDSQDERIASGMTAEVTIVTNSKENVLALPARAIDIDDEGAMYVMRRAGESEEKVIIETGLRGSDSFMEILSGLAEGDTIVIPE